MNEEKSNDEKDDLEDDDIEPDDDDLGDEVEDSEMVKKDFGEVKYSDRISTRGILEELRKRAKTHTLVLSRVDKTLRRFVHMWKENLKNDEEFFDRSKVDVLLRQRIDDLSKLVASINERLDYQIRKGGDGGVVKEDVVEVPVKKVVDDDRFGELARLMSRISGRLDKLEQDNVLKDLGPPPKPRKDDVDDDIDLPEELI